MQTPIRPEIQVLADAHMKRLIEAAMEDSGSLLREVTDNPTAIIMVVSIRQTLRDMLHTIGD